MGSRQEALAAFLEITQSSDRDQAKRLLVATGWNLEKALALHFEDPAPTAPNPRAGLSSTNSPPSPHAAFPSTGTSLFEELNRDIVGEAAPHVLPRPSVYTTKPYFLGLIVRPFQIVAGFLHSLFCFVSYWIPLLPRLTGYNPQLPSRAVADQLDPKRVAARYARSFEEMFGPNELPFSEGSYMDALSKAKNDLKYLVMLLTSPYSETGGEAIKVLMDPRATALLKRNDVIFWAGSVHETEGYQLANGLNVTKFPFVGLVGPSPKTPQSSTVIMEVLAKAPGGYTSVEQFMRAVDENMDSHSPKLLALRLSRDRAGSDRQIRAEQDSAYERSLARDRSRAEERQQQELAQRAEEELQRQARDGYAGKLEQWKKYRAHEFACRGNIPDAARIRIGMPSGERIVGKFAGTDPVRTIYEYVLCHGVEEERIPAPTDFVPQFPFKLVSPMPRRVLDASTTEIQTVPEIWPNGSLLIDEDVDEEV